MRYASGREQSSCSLELFKLFALDTYDWVCVALNGKRLRCTLLRPYRWVGAARIDPNNKDKSI